MATLFRLLGLRGPLGRGQFVLSMAGQVSAGALATGALTAAIVARADVEALDAPLGLFAAAPLSLLVPLVLVQVAMSWFLCTTLRARLADLSSSVWWMLPVSVPPLVATVGPLLSEAVGEPVTMVGSLATAAVLLLLVAWPGGADDGPPPA